MRTVLGISASSQSGFIPAGDFPTATSVGVPAGWTPTTTVSGDQTITTPGTIYQDVLITSGNLEVYAANVTVRRCKLLAGRIRNDAGSTQYSPVTYQQCTVNGVADESTMTEGGFHAVDCLLTGGEGFGCSGGTNPVPPALSIIEHCYVHCNPPVGAGEEWHGDALQGYLGGDLEIYNSVLWLESEPPPREGTAALFWADESGHLKVDGLICRGGGYSFRSYFPMNINRLYVVEDAWIYGPVDNDCSQVEAWTNSYFCTLDAGGQPVPTTVLNCNS